jgi:hypothetical protein
LVSRGRKPFLIFFGFTSIIFVQGDNMQKFINVDPMEPGMIMEDTSLLAAEPDDEVTLKSQHGEVHFETFDESSSIHSSVGRMEVGRDSSIASSETRPSTVTSKARESKAYKEPKSVRK